MKSKAPLYEQLVKHYQKSPISFHVPGHKMGKGFNPQGEDFFEQILKIDATELPGLDDLHQPTGVILEAEQMAAQVFEADYTFFLVNGTTSGNLAVILAVCQPGDKIIIQRNVHKSVINAIILARAIPIYINPEIIPDIGILGSVFIDQLREVLNSHPDVKAVFITNPNYYGIGIDLKELSLLVHRYNIPLLVDEAHGAHFGFHPLFPKSSIQQGADSSVQSTHKTLSAMTMGSMLHVKSKFIDIERLKFFLSVVQTASPSYPIMASLDLTRQWLDNEGERLWEKQLQLVQWFYGKIKTLQKIAIIDKINERYLLDPLKIIIHSRQKSISGYYIQKELEKKRIYTELADLKNTLAIVTFGIHDEDIVKLYYGLTEIDDQISKLSDINNFDITADCSLDYYNIFKYKESKVSLEKVIYGKKRMVPVKNAIGEIAAEMVIPYPPGIPLIHLGEEITKEIVDYLFQLKDKGAKFQGARDNNLINIQVLEH